MSFTPGLWKIGYGGQEGDGYYAIVSTERNHAIAEGEECTDISDSEIRANARLIAAAPEMLNMIEEIQHWLEQDSWDLLIDSKREMMAKVRHVISRATSIRKETKVCRNRVQEITDMRNSNNCKTYREAEAWWDNRERAYQLFPSLYKIVGPGGENEAQEYNDELETWFSHQEVVFRGMPDPEIKALIGKYDRLCKSRGGYGYMD